ncbi:MAG: TRAP transporter substrate-binding protein DctP [Pseudolabrys sp.]|nr:TRAP transporter substrate-binding protein DctP [Pseudolabrys sp.]
MKLSLSPAISGVSCFALAAAVAIVVASPADVSAQEKLQPVTIRLVADHPPVPHPAAISQTYFQKRLAEVIPGSEMRIYHAGALYTVPEALEAMGEGNLEMTWGQFGKTAASDKWMNVVAGPMLLTTPAAMEKFDTFETVGMLKERFEKLHNVKVFGTAHMSMYMGAGAKHRLQKPDDLKARKIRSMGPAENAALSAWGASPVTMTFGDVPPALQTGVLDGLLTSLGGWNSVRNQAPYFTVAGINGIVGDYYWIGASQKWWSKLNKTTQAAIEKLIVEEVLPFQHKINWCNDKRVLDQFGTSDPSKPGIYVLNASEQEAFAKALGDATTKWVKANSPADAHQWADRFAKEARAASVAHPMGTSEVEKTDCAQMAQYFPQKK